MSESDGKRPDVFLFAGPITSGCVRNAALVKNIDERGRNSYFASVVCLNAPCQAQGPQVLAGMRLVVEYANATVVAPHGQRFYSVGLTYKGTLGSLLFPATYVSTIGSQDTYTVNANLVQYVEAGDTPGQIGRASWRE